MHIPGFTTDSLDAVEQLLYGEIDWQKQFKTGKGPGPEKKENYDTGTTELKGIAGARIGKGPGDMGKRKVNTQSEGLSGVALPKGPGNPQGGSSRQVQGMRMFAEGQKNPYEGECNQKEKRKADKQPRTPAQEKADKKRAQQGRDSIDPQTRSEAARKSAETRAKCRGLR